jgi:hypothetical protein
VINSVNNFSSDLPFQQVDRNSSASDPKSEGSNGKTIQDGQEKKSFDPIGTDISSSTASNSNSSNSSTQSTQNQTELHRENIQDLLHRQEIRQEILQQELERAEKQKAERDDFSRNQESTQDAKQTSSREDARKQFFEDLSKVEAQQEKMSKIFQEQINIAFIGKHANLTA